MKGEAEAFAIEAKAKAEAEQMEKKANAWKEYQDAAVVDMILDVLPKVCQLVHCATRGFLVFSKSVDMMTKCSDVSIAVATVGLPLIQQIFYLTCVYAEHVCLPFSQNPCSIVA